MVYHCTHLQHMPAYKLSKVHVGGTLSKRIDDLKFRAKWHRSARGELPAGIRGTKWIPLPGPPPCVISGGGGSGGKRAAKRSRKTPVYTHSTAVIEVPAGPRRENHAAFAGICSRRVQDRSS